ncbi:MetQ/NlpA family ABC transporter substrate-binding protein [uncultured Brevibacillus sp.]|uniref:MetQ/NlpA family ABC transporter substrate-binding protein n=1 Tax=uncultured Brevibacillus sp. TaxID=169970 RepID=UPI002596314F|nr:MetQ/NlpA family ABC transporter substrate-binding protein [uncultured Brevibacillus sp.]
MKKALGLLALAEKEIDANSYQSIPFLETYKKEHKAGPPLREQTNIGLMKREVL